MNYHGGGLVNWVRHCYMTDQYPEKDTNAGYFIAYVHGFDMDADIEDEQ